MRKFLWFVFVVIAQYFSVPVSAYELNVSGRTEIWDNPFIAYGYNPKTKILTGYIAALRTAPGRTDACKLVFTGAADGKNLFSVKYIGRKLPPEKLNIYPAHASLVVDKNASYLKFLKENLRGDCDWILPFVIESESTENPDEILVEMAVQHAGDWISVYAIGAHEAKFHSRPDVSAVEKEFLVKGDIIYVYDEQPGWYFVKYKEGKKKAEGWIKKFDTLQP